LQEHLIIAIDGPAGAGKSTLARRLASRLGFVYIDTGAMYRAVALWARRAGLNGADDAALERLARDADIVLTEDSRVILNGEDVTREIRDPEISQSASKVSAVGGVRRALVEKQQRMGGRTSLVMEGRDIGTVVFPEAGVKIFLDASPEVRAERRLKELREKGVDADPADVAREMRERDERDRTRADSPLRQAPDAVYVDTSAMTLDEAEEALLSAVRARMNKGKESSR
jgi:cytidylate kinase